MDVIKQQDHVEAVAGRLVEVAPPGWVRLVGNWEATLDDRGSPVLNFLTLAVIDGGDRWLYGQVDYDETLYDLVAAFNRWSDGQGPNRRWTVLDLEVDADGSYRTEFGYDEPKRSNGIMDQESLGRFEDYLETWVAVHGPAPRAAS